MESRTKHCIISVGVNGWYPQGLNRLENSLLYHGYYGHIFFNHHLARDWQNQHEQNPYAFKIAAFQNAIDKDYKLILWLDASFWAIKNPYPIFDIMNGDGYFLVSNGNNARQECNDKCLDYFNIGYDEAVNVPMISSGCVGLNMENGTAQEFFNMWKQSCIDGIFKGSRNHNPEESNDPRFLYHRQDQSAASCIAYKLGMKIYPLGEEVTYYPNATEKTIYFINGL